MNAMILAAGKGERMLPLTLTTPKPLLQAGGKPLIQYHIEALVAANVSRIVINTGRLGEQIEAWFGNAGRYGVELLYSHEGAEPLGTGGGIFRALPLLGADPFWLVNGDVWTDFDYSKIPVNIVDQAHLILVDNPQHNPDGDFILSGSRVMLVGQPRLTYSGIGLYQPGLFMSVREPLFSLVPLLKQAIGLGQVSGQHYSGNWFDIGTPDRLEALNQWLIEN
jgi:MurNAc alpha-1-phosphate uridylyltransferase